MRMLVVGQVGGSMGISKPSYLILIMFIITGCEWGPHICVNHEEINNKNFEITSGKNCQDHSGTRRLQIDDASSGVRLWDIYYNSMDNTPTSVFTYGVTPKGYSVDVSPHSLIGVCIVRVYSDWSSVTIPIDIIGGEPCLKTQ